MPHRQLFSVRHYFEIYLQILFTSCLGFGSLCLTIIVYRISVELDGLVCFFNNHYKKDAYIFDIIS